MNNKKIVVMTTLLLAIILLGVGTISYFRRSVNGNITGQTGTLVFNVNGLTGETSETLNYSLNRSASEPYVYPDDSGYFDLEITAEGSSTDVYVTLDILRDNLPDNLKFYVDEEHKVVINKKYFFFEKTEEMSDTLRIYWFWDGSVDDINDSEFINESLSARITLTAEPMEYGMIENGSLEVFSTGLFAGYVQPKYFTAVKEITFTNDFSGMPEECTEENLCFNMSYDENQKYPVYAYLVETGETGTIMDAKTNEFTPGITDISELANITTGKLYNLYIVCSKKVFAPINSMGLFGYHINLQNINFNDWFYTSSVTNMMSMFAGCSNLTSLDLSSFDTSSVTDMQIMFSNCSSLTNLNLSSFDTSSVTDMNSMFNDCRSLTNLNLSSFDTSGVTNMVDMFRSCSSLTSLNLSSFDTSSVTDMNHMFYDCRSLTNLNLSSFDTSSVTDMNYMFWSCSSLTSLNLSSFDTSSVTDMTSMFNGCSNLTSLNLSSFDTSSVTNMNYMFCGCSSLTNLNLSSFDTSSVTDMGGMFHGCSNLTTTITIRGNVSVYGFMFFRAATNEGAKITVNYTSSTNALVDNMVADKSSNSNVVKGSLVTTNN